MDCMRCMKSINNCTCTCTALSAEPPTPLAQAISLAVDTCHGAARDAGWWDREKTWETFPRCLMLITSEIAEAMEGDRKGLNDDHLPHRPMTEVELADALIRICDLAGAYDLDLAGAVAEKLAYNAKRADHKREARQASGGKSY